MEVSTEIAPIVPPRFKRNVSPVTAGMRCFTITQARTNLAPLISRGCVQFIGTNELTCRFAANDQPTIGCSLCEGNGCNSSSMHFISITTILAAFFIAMRFY